MILGMENSADILVHIAGRFCFASDIFFFIQLHEKQKGGGGKSRWNTLEIVTVSWIYQLREKLGGIKIYD